MRLRLHLEAAGRARFGALARARADRAGEVLRLDPRDAEDREALHVMLELAHVAGPVVRRERGDGARREHRGCAGPREKLLREERDVTRSLAKRRNVELEHLEAKE